MRFKLLADLHLEFHADGGREFLRQLTPCDVDALVLAGDIHVEGKRLREVLLHFCGKYPLVLFVAGNHEYYNKDIVEVNERWNTHHALPENVHVLVNKTVILDGVRFIGTTMWTDFNNEDWFAVQAAKKGMNDFYLIENDGRMFTPLQSVELFQQNKKFLVKELSDVEHKPTVVVTHHLPSFSLVNERFAGSILNAAYAANMDRYVPLADLWIHGHTHESNDTYLGDCRVICNPRGYVGSDIWEGVYASIKRTKFGKKHFDI